MFTVNAINNSQPLRGVRSTDQNPNSILFEKNVCLKNRFKKIKGPFDDRMPKKLDYLA